VHATPAGSLVSAGAAATLASVTLSGLLVNVAVTVREALSTSP